MSRRKKLRIVALLVGVVFAFSSTAAVAATVVYKKNVAPPSVWVTSSTDAIRGGQATSIPLNNVWIRTTTSFYPYYPYVTGASTYWVSIAHGIYDPARSRCMIAPFEAFVECTYTR